VAPPGIQRVVFTENRKQKKKRKENRTKTKRKVRAHLGPGAAREEPLAQPQVEAVERSGDLVDVAQQHRAVGHAVQHRLDVQQTAVGLRWPSIETTVQSSALEKEESP